MHTKNTASPTQSKELSHLLDISIIQYTTILKLLTTIAKAQGNNRTSEISSTGIALFNKQKVAAKTDKNLMQVLNTYPEGLKEARLRERSQLIKDIITINKHITPKFKDMKILMFNELQQIKTGRTAIQGYQQTERKQGKNINNAL